MEIPEKGHDDAIEIGIGDDEKENVELKAWLDVLMDLLQRQRY